MPYHSYGLWIPYECHTIAMRAVFHNELCSTYYIPYLPCSIILEYLRTRLFGAFGAFGALRLLRLL